MANSKIGRNGRPSWKSPEYYAWRNMRYRCQNPTHHEYHNYGARGIKVCERWQDFGNFYADMGPRPDGRSLDRIDNDGNYEPRNCRWATPMEQKLNRRTTVLLTIDGETRHLCEWARRYGIDARTVGSRLKRGIGALDALTLPLTPRNRERQNKPPPIVDRGYGITDAEKQELRRRLEEGKCTGRNALAREWGVSIGRLERAIWTIRHGARR